MNPIMLAVLLVNLGAGGDGRQVLFEGSIGAGTVDETAVSPSGEHHAFVVHASDADTLYVDGKRAASHDRIQHVTVLDSGDLYYWYQDGKEEHVSWAGRGSGPYNGVYMPDVALVARLATPTTAEWTFRGGTRTVFATRDQRGDWVATQRFPAAPTTVESRHLPTSRVWHETPDPTAESSRPRRYSLLAGRVPAFLVADGDKECLVVGDRKLACGESIAMLAYATRTGRLVYAYRNREGLYVDTGKQVHGPTENVDWVALSPDGEKLAFVMKDGDDKVLILDDAEVARYDLIESVAWTPDGKLVFLGHDKEGSHLFVDHKAVLDKRIIERVYVSPTGRVLAFGSEGLDHFLHPYTLTAKLESMWAEGFLAGGEFFAQLKLSANRHALIFNGSMSALYHGVSKLTPSPDGKFLCGVAATVEDDHLLSGAGEEHPAKGRVERLDWCSGGRVMARVKEPKQDCLLVDGNQRFCCPRIVAAGCGWEDKPFLLCMTPDGYTAYHGTAALGEPFDEVPMHLIYQDSRAGILDFAARRKTDWYLVVNGKEEHANGTPAFVYPARNGGWFLVTGSGGSRWVTRSVKSAWYTTAKPPFFVGETPVFLARSKGKESWLSPAGPLGWEERITSAVREYDGGFLYWARSGTKHRLVKAVLK